MQTITTFAQIAPLYLAERVVTPHYAKNVSRVAARAGVLSVERMNRHLTQRVAKVAGTTVRSERTILLTLWKWAYDRSLVETAPRGVLRMKARKKPTRAWTVDEIKKLLAATKPLDAFTMRTGASQGLFLRCWILVCYESGSRFGDCMAFRAEHLHGDTLSWVQSKTGDPLTRPLSDACLAACREMLTASPDGRILGWACGSRMAQKHMRELIDTVGIGGTSKFLRRSGATHCEMAQAGAGRLHLGHRSPALFEQAYCDWSQLRTKTPRTPALM